MRNTKQIKQEIENKLFLMRFFEEKELPQVMFDIRLKDTVHLIDTDAVITMLQNIPDTSSVVKKLRILDFQNASKDEFLKFLRHVAVGLLRMQGY